MSEKFPSFKSLSLGVSLLLTSYGVLAQRSPDFRSDTLPQRGEAVIGNPIEEYPVLPTRNSLNALLHSNNPLPKNIISIPYRAKNTDIPAETEITEELTEADLIQLIANDSTTNNTLNLPETLPLDNIFNFKEVTYEYLDSGEGESSFIMREIKTNDGVSIAFENLDPKIQEQIHSQIKHYLENFLNHTPSQD